VDLRLANVEPHLSTRVTITIDEILNRRFTDERLSQIQERFKNNQVIQSNILIENISRKLQNNQLLFIFHNNLRYIG